MRFRVVGLVALGLTLAAISPRDLAGQAQRPDPNEAFLDPEKAGPDFGIQGEYEGEIGRAKWGAQVMAYGDGLFPLVLLPGGLPGAGWDGKTRIKLTAKTVAGKTAFKGSNNKSAPDFGWTGEIANGMLIGRNKDGDAFTLRRVVRQSPTLGAKPPAGAVVLFDGSGVGEWTGAKLVDGLLGFEKSKNALSKKAFRDFKAHIEFRTPFMPRAQGQQARGNSGVYIQNRYEIQVHDSLGMEGKKDECGAIYNQKAPLLNMSLPPLTWQTYDIEFQAGRFDSDGKKKANAVLTLWHNGVKVHDRLELMDVSLGGDKTESDKPGPLHLQNFLDRCPVYYRNIWVVEQSP